MYVFSSHCAISSTSFFFFNDTATTEIYTLSLHDALPISSNACGLIPKYGARASKLPAPVAPVLVVIWVELGAPVPVKQLVAQFTVMGLDGLASLGWSGS